MASLEPIWNRARVDLSLTTETGDPDVFLWEHSARVGQYALQIAQIPDIKANGPDMSSVLAAALYHDAGWAVRVRAGEAKRLEILVRPNPENHREQGALLMETSLEGLLSRESLERASRAIRTLNDRVIPLLEGRIVSDAENLDEFGVLSFWPAVRRGALEGKGIKTVIDTWRRRQEYHFWTARLGDSFRFASVREIARARLAKLERAMEELEQQHLGADILPPVDRLAETSGSHSQDLKEAWHPEATA